MVEIYVNNGVINLSAYYKYNSGITIGMQRVTRCGELNIPK